MTPSEARSSLDRMLAGAGRSATLTRYFGAARTPLTVSLRVHLTGFTPNELARDSSLVAGERKAIISPTEINASDWPGTDTGPQTEPGDKRIPRHGDTLTLGTGEVLTVKYAHEATYVGDELVRINLVVV
jgi:hypothetical protein